MIDHLLHTFLLLFVAVDPIGVAALFVGLTQGESADYRRHMAWRGAGLAALVLVVFALFGDGLLTALRISLPAFRIAGGVLLFLLAIDMVFARHSGVRAPTAREQAEAEHRKDISVFPLAIPLIAGPGAITTVLLTAANGHGSLLLSGALLAVLAAVLLITLVSLLAAGRIMRLIGETGANVVGRVFGIVLAALAVQFILDGLRAGLPPASIVLPTAL